MIRLRPLASLGLAALGLAGCSNAQTPAALPVPTTTTSEPTATSEVTPTPVATPSSTRTRDLPEPEPVLQEFSELGATVFAAYYVQVLNYSRNTGDVELLRSISDAGCEGCHQDMEQVRAFAQLGYSHLDLETRFQGAQYLSWDPAGDEIELQVSVDRSPHVIVDGTGKELEQVPGAVDASFYLWLRWIDGEWIVWESI